MPSIEVDAAEINVLFNEVYNAAPALPRPLKSKFPLQFITAEGLLKESLAVAPLDLAEEAKLTEYGLGDVCSLETDGIVTRTVKRNTIYMNKAKEFAVVHQELADWYDGVISKLQTTQTAISAILSIMLMVKLPFLKQNLVSDVVAIMTLVLSITKSWIVTAGWDELRSKHSIAARNFAVIVDDITNFLAVLADVPGDDVRDAFGNGGGLDAGPEQGDASVTAGFARRAIGLMANVRSGGANLKKAVLDVFEQAQADYEAHEDQGPEPSEPQAVVRRLRRMYREALEYRVAHSFFESRFRKVHVAMTFVHLILSSLMSAVLFLKHLIPFAESIGTGLSLVLTFLNTATQTLALPGRVNEHANGRQVFANIQRQFATVLIMEPPAAIAARFSEYSSKWSETKGNTKTLKPVQLQTLRNNDGSLMLPLITPTLSPDSSCLAMLPGGRRFVSVWRRARGKVHAAPAGDGKHGLAAAEHVQAAAGLGAGDGRRGPEMIGGQGLQEDEPPNKSPDSVW